MGQLRKIQELDHEGASDIKKIIKNSFPPMLGFKVQYYLGEDSDTHKEMLCFDISSNTFGSLYRKIAEIRPPKSVMDYQTEFFGRIMQDFVVLGTTFLTNGAVHSQNSLMANKEVVKRFSKDPFREGVLKGHINLN